MYPGTILGVSILEWQTTFVFTGAVSTGVTISLACSHLSVNGMETTVTLPSASTLIEASHSTYFTLRLFATTSTLEINREMLEFTVKPDTIYGGDNVRFCRTNNGQTSTNCSKAVRVEQRASSHCLGGPTSVFAETDYN